jgi:thymidine kinase
LLGEFEEYEPLSRAAFYKTMLRDKVRNMKVNDPEEISSKQKQSNA